MDRFLRFVIGAAIPLVVAMTLFVIWQVVEPIVNNTTPSGRMLFLVLALSVVCGIAAALGSRE